MIYPGAYCTCGAAVPLLPTQKESVIFIKLIYAVIPLEGQVLSQISLHTCFHAETNFSIHFTLDSVEIIIAASNWKDV